MHLLHSSRKPALPICLLDLGDQFERTRTTLVNGRAFEAAGQIVAYFRDSVPEATDEIDAVFGFTRTTTDPAGRSALGV